jgi:LacI family transcriptional regulator
MTRHAESGRPCVAGDDHRGGYLAGRHLLGRGLTDLAVIAGPAHATTANDRLAGFRDALAEAGVALPPERVVRSEFDVAGGRAAGMELLSGPNRPRGIFAVSDSIAIGVVGVARDVGLTIPDDLGLVGYNDIPVAAQLPVPLTTVRSPARRIGITAFKRLLDVIAHRDVESARLPVELVVRGT